MLIPLRTAAPASMAAIFNRASLAALRGVYRIRPRRPVQPFCSPFSSQFAPLRADNTVSPASNAAFLASLDERGRAFYDSLSPEEKIEYERDVLRLDEYMNSPEVKARLNAQLARAVRELEMEEGPERVEPRKPFREGLLAMGETDPEDVGEDEAFQGDDMTTMGHGELDQHREMREYARIISWEMPLLSSKSQPPSLFPQPRILGNPIVLGRRKR
jgi:small subunit ribosomal protein S35